MRLCVNMSAKRRSRSCRAGRLGRQSPCGAARSKAHAHNAGALGVLTLRFALPTFACRPTHAARQAARAASMQAAASVRACERSRPASGQPARRNRRGYPYRGNGGTFGGRGWALDRRRRRGLLQYLHPRTEGENFRCHPGSGKSSTCLPGKTPSGKNSRLKIGGQFFLERPRRSTGSTGAAQLRTL
jgi:hypothetical protein